MTYQEGLLPLRGAAFWPSTDEANVHRPTNHSMSSRPKENRRKKEVNESPTNLKKFSKEQCIVIYGTLIIIQCFTRSHHNRLLAESSQGESSQVETTQASLNDV